MTTAETTGLTLDTVLAKAQQYRNWGRWGADDELGSLNYLTPDKVIASAGLVKKGKVFSLALPLDDDGPMNGFLGRHNPSHHMLWDGGDIAAGAQDHLAQLRFTDDAAYMVLQSSTQWDALAHIYHNGQMYNGHGTDMVTSRGAIKNSITNVKDKAVGRGVLLDVPRFKNLPWLEPGEPITDTDLLATAQAQNVEVGEGDFVLVRTGQIAQRRHIGTWGDYAGGSAPGLAISASDFFCPRRVAAVATDTWGAEVLPNEGADVYQPLHIIMLVNAGILLGEMWDMDDLADDCADDGVYEFQLVAPPLTFTGAVGSPVNPQAIK
ncbi:MULTISPECIES: cyclase family protein [unclassified Rhodococcus (in: high G+C Gram-positive bacteria)]|uniref:cyclase family protein n=1 Tax=unclassified Rhodococcus (in: high G+C Gram-positive bacteria) TaxID=192944 RepID=UPI000380DA0A|nr:cyclase family protein [Rhodococcus sp. DK17]